MTKDGETREFEIKISRSDFLVDSKKKKHSAHESGANYFYYVCPKGMINPSEIEKKYGLIYIWETGFVEVVKKPRRLNESIFENWKQIANKMYWKWENLWREKYYDKKISYDEYKSGFFNTELLTTEE